MNCPHCSRPLSEHDKLIETATARLKKLRAERQALLKMRAAVAKPTEKRKARDDG